MVHRGNLDGVTALCKLHGKHSLDGGRAAIVGEMWRRSAVLSLIGSRERILDNLDNLDRLDGILGPAHLLFPNKRLPEEPAWDGTKPTVRTLAGRLGVENPALEFFGGSMFWLDGRVLPALARLRISADDFEAEAAIGRGSLAHACERIFVTAARAAGLDVQTSPIRSSGSG